MMHCYVQWTTDPPQGWQRYEVEELASLPAKPAPRPGHRQGNYVELVDDKPGWCHGVCVQGLTFDEFDHYCVVPFGREACRIVAWYDDPQDRGEDRLAIEVDFLPMLRDGDGRIVNTNQHRTQWATEGVRHRWTKGGRVEHDFDWRDWDEFVPPTGNVFHGVWCDPHLHRELLRLRENHPWTEWRE